MKKGIIISSLFAIMLFAGAASAQNVRLFSGRVHTFVCPAVGTASIPTFDLVAGEPIRLQAGAARISAANNLKQISLAVHSYPTPCDGEPAVRKSGGTQQNYLTISMSEIFPYATDTAWKGTCRMLSVKFRDGRDHQARIRFR